MEKYSLKEFYNLSRSEKDKILFRTQSKKKGVTDKELMLLDSHGVYKAKNDQQRSIANCISCRYSYPLLAGSNPEMCEMCTIWKNS